MRRWAPALAALLALAGAAPVGPAFKPGYGDVPKVVAPAFWAAQPERLAAALHALRPQDPKRRDVYLLAVAAGGAQPLFDHEAKVALDVLGAHFGAAGRTMLLSNRFPDAAVPLATAENLARAIAALGRTLDPAQDLLVVYLAAHGAPDASLGTDLPGAMPLRAIDAPGLRDALDAAGIKRRVVIVSACFAASWAEALGGEDTLMIAAARPDRTSFGCDLDRSITYFGEAFLEQSHLRTTSLAAAFATARGIIAAREKAEGLEPSEPQAIIGPAMAALWRETPNARAASTAAPRTARRRP